DPSAATAPSSADHPRDRRTRPDHLTARTRSSRDRYWDQRTSPESPLSPPLSSLWPDSVPQPPERGDGLVATMTRVGLVAGFAALVALLVVFGKPMLEPVLDTVRPILNSDSPSQPTKQATKSTERATADARSGGVSTAAMASLPTGTPSSGAQASASGQQTASISNPLGDDRSVTGPVRGVTDREIRFGISAPFTGPAKELGQNMKLGIEAAFNVANANG